MEHAYQAAKATSLVPAMEIRALATPGEAKRYGRKPTDIRADWEEVKVSVMFDLVFRKFLVDGELRELLLGTDRRRLVEGNFWHDNFWGDCCCMKRPGCRDEGKNVLGGILMLVRGVLA